MIHFCNFFEKIEDRFQTKSKSIENINIFQTNPYKKWKMSSNLLALVCSSAISGFGRSSVNFWPHGPIACHVAQIHDATQLTQWYNTVWQHRGATHGCNTILQHTTATQHPHTNQHTSTQLNNATSHIFLQCSNDQHMVCKAMVQQTHMGGLCKIDRICYQCCVVTPFWFIGALARGLVFSPQ